MLRLHSIAISILFLPSLTSEVFSQQSSGRDTSIKNGEVADRNLNKQKQSLHFHSMAQQRPGILLPLYHYPANIHTNLVFNSVMDIKRRFPTVPMWVILNPATGPGTVIDPNYSKAIDRLVGSGCVVLAYVSTEYGKRDSKLVETDLDNWQKFYPRIQGVFFDEMIYQDTIEAVDHQSGLSNIAKSKGYWPIVTNPGAETPERFFRDMVSDVIIVHESAEWPVEERIHGNYFGGYSDYPPHTRGILVHSMKKYDESKVKMMSRYSKWLYVTDDEYRLKDPSAPNPWDSLSEHLETLCAQLSKL